MKVHLRKSRQKGRFGPAFTLIELMVVIAIILVLATFVVGGMGWYKRKAAVGKTTVLLGSISRALEEYRLENGAFPTGDGGDKSTEEVFAALYGDADKDGSPDDGATVYLNVLDPNLTGNKQNVISSGGSYIIIDAWGEAYRYQSPGDMNPQDDFDLWSFGPDGKGGPNSGTKRERSDDIKNW